MVNSQLPGCVSSMALPQVSKGLVRFGVFEADFRAGELRKKGGKILIAHPPLRGLSVLVERPGEIVSREELRHALWPEGVFVEFDQGISSAIRRLREALGDSADNPVFIETVERRGYRWIAPTHLPAEASRDKGEQEKEAKIGAEVPQLPISPPFSSPWRKLIFALPVLALLFAIWIFRPAYRSARASEKSKAPTSSGSLHHAANREAEDYYLKGRFYWNKRTPESLNQAVDSFTQAIVHDPG